MIKVKKSNKDLKLDHVINQNSNQKIKLTIDKMRVVATWEYATENSDCALCHRDLMMPIVMNDANQPRYVGDVTIGSCNHGFHSSCIKSWLSHGNANCPHCQAIWKTNNNVGSSVYVYKSTI